MKITFYGTRGSIPVCEEGFQEFGGNTTCIELSTLDSNSIAIFDAGTGIRMLGKRLLKSAKPIPDEIFIAFSHFHLDHIQGFPFFDLAYHKGVTIKILALGKGRNIGDLKGVFSTQMQAEYFPVQLDNMGAHFEFLHHDLSTEIFKKAKVTAVRHNHPGGAYSYCIEREGKKVVISTDIEHGDSLDQNIIDLAQGADLLIHEAQYTSEELKTHKGWGHSSYEQAIEVAKLAKVKQLVMTHHDPDHDDDFLLAREKECRALFENAFLAREGMEINI